MEYIFIDVESLIHAIWIIDVKLIKSLVEGAIIFLKKMINF